MRLEKAIAITGRRFFAAHALTEAAIVLTAAGAALSLAGAFDRFFPLPWGLRAGLLVALVLFAGARLRALSRWHRTSRERAAIVLDRSGGCGRVRGAEELCRLGETVPGDRTFKEAEIAAVERMLDPQELPRPIVRRALRIVVLWLAIGILLLGFGSGPASHQARRVAAPWLALPPLAGEHIRWLWPPDGYTAPYAAAVTAEVMIARPAGEPRLVVRGRARTEVPLVPGDGSRWKAAVGPLEEDVALEVVDGPFSSGERRVTVSPAASIASVELALTFPAYTKVEPRRLRVETDRVRILAGTAIAIEVVAEDAGAGSFSFRAGDREVAAGRLIPANGKLVGSLAILEGGELALDVGEGSRGRKTILLECIPDEPPAVEIAFPPPLLLACAGSRVPVEVDARDDFGLAEITIAAGERTATEHPGGARERRVQTSLDVSEGEMRDLAVSARAADNREPVPGTREAPPRIVRPVARDVFALLRRRDGLALLARRIAAAKDHAAKVLDMSRALGEKPEFSNDEAGPLVEELRELARVTAAVRDDPVIAGVESLARPLLERAGALEKLIAAAPPPAPADRKAWISFVSYFAEELLAVFDGIVPPAERLGGAEPLIIALAQAARLPDRQEAILRGVERGGELARAQIDEEEVRADIQALPGRIERLVEPALAPVASEVVRTLGDPALRADLDRAVEKLTARDREAAIAAAREVRTRLEPLRALVSAPRTFESVDFAELIAAVAAGEAAWERHAKAGFDRAVLWGPGADSAPTTAAPPPEPMGGPVTLAVPRPPAVREDLPDFYRPIIQAYGGALDRLVPGRRAPEGRKP